MIIWRNPSTRGTACASGRSSAACEERRTCLVHSYRFGDVSVNFESGDVRKGRRAYQPRRKGASTACYLVEQRGTVVPREELLQKVWEYQSDVSSRTIDVHIAWLRQKLEDHPQNPKYIHTIRGKGYRFSM